MEIKKLDKIKEKQIQIPTSKSYLNRALIISSCCNGIVKLTNIVDVCDDSALMIDVLRSIGVKIDIDLDKKEIIVHGNGGKFIRPKNGIINTGIAGTVTRFILGLSVLFDFDCEIVAEGKMLNRPIKDLVDAISDIGVKVKYLLQDGLLPVKILQKKEIKNHEIFIKSSKSSQFLTSLLMISSMIGINSIKVENLVSESYIDITLNIMYAFNVDIKREKLDNNCYIFHIENQKYFLNLNYKVDTDWSSASYFLALKYLIKNELKIEELNENSHQGDTKFVDIIEKFRNHEDKNKKLILDMKNMPDTIMTAIVVAIFHDFQTEIFGAITLKDKESNRLEAMKSELEKINIKSEISDDWNSILIHGNSKLEVKKMTEIETYYDHRIAMCFGILGLKTGNIAIKNPSVVNKSFPSFWAILNDLYA